jgi:hypothetical protein
MTDLRYGSLGRIVAIAIILAGGITALACSSENEAVALQGQPGVLRAGGQLASFKSDAELVAFLKKRRDAVTSRSANSPAAIEVSAPAPMAAQADAAKAGSSDRITNTQEADVDEGGIVKKRGDLLVILRRGRLFTVSIAGGQMRPIDHINAFPPGITGGGDWYDEMLISGDRVIVIGYSYARGGTEVNRFRLSPDGRLKFEDAYHLRSNDYYSSRNYASRLIGDRLVYYTPLYLGRWDGDPFAGFPAVSRWQKDRKPVFQRIARARDVYIVPSQRNDEEAELDTLHSVMDCSLTAPVMDCKATAVLGPASHTFYVSPTAVYLWVSDGGHWRAGVRGRAQSWLYRMPLDGIERPSAIGARGQPTDQFSFREDGKLGLVDVLVRSDGGGDWMWNSESSSGDVALLSVPIAWMGDGSRTAPRSRYRQLPPVGEDAWNFQNRFVNNHVLYGGHGYGGGQTSTLVAAGLRGGPVAQLKLGHAVERLDQLVEDGVVIGNDPRGGLTFTAVDLRRPVARIGNSFTFPAAQQGENRSQAFFFRPDTADGSSGVLGLPITTQLKSQYARFLGSGSSILFLRRENRMFDMAGRLDADPKGALDDACVASCVDWYGNARPIFIGNRVFALMGYELVEGRLARGGAIGEVARVNFAPPSRRPLGR